MNPRWLNIPLLTMIIGLLITYPRLSAGEISGTLSADTTLTADENPWLVAQDVIIPDNIILTINAGVVMNFGEGAGIKVQQGGKLQAEGSEDNRILMTRPSESNADWDGIEFQSSLEDNVLGYIDMEYGDGRSNWISIRSSKVSINAMSWQETNKTIIEVDHPSLLVKNCIFPNVGSVETVHGQYLRDEEYLIIDGNTFGSTLGYNDVIDFTDCKRPGPILEVYNNVFLGGSDDALDLDGTDTHIEGNVFRDFHKGHDGTSTSNAIATGKNGGDVTDIVVVRNLFVNCDHAVLLKEGCYMTSENNSYVNCDEGGVNFSEWPDRTVAPGRGASFKGDIFWNISNVFGNMISQPGNDNPEIIVNQCLLPDSLHHLGDNNFNFDPQFVNSDSDFHLQSNSPAVGIGPNGLDLGCYVPGGVSISGEPDSVTYDTTANLIIDGPGQLEYRYSINSNEGTWSRVLSIADNPVLMLTGLEIGQSYTVYVIGKNSAGRWQEIPTASRTWQIDSSPNSIKTSILKFPADPELLPNYPNPFNPVTKFGFNIAEAGFVKVSIHDLLGRKVLNIYNGFMEAGNYKQQWNGQDTNGTAMPSGTYLIRLETGNTRLTRKIILLR